MSIADARDLADGERLSADVCIVGAGPAGITVARQLEGQGLAVLLLEGGGEGPDAQVQDLYRGPNRGEPYYDLDQTRLRQLGGSTNHWEGYTRPLDAEDFDVPVVDDLGGWPFGLDELREHYVTASAMCDVDDRLDHTGDTWSGRAGEELLATDPDVLRTEVLLLSPPTRFGAKYRDELAESDDISVLLHANVVELAAEEGRVTRATIAHFDGRMQHVEAETFVLATGGIEIPRLLLASDDGDGGAIGNQNDLVGRSFMEHPHLGGLQLVTGDASAIPFYTEQPEVDGQTIKAIMTIPHEVRRSHGIGNVAIELAQPGPFARGYLDDDPLTGAVRGLLRHGSGYDAPDHLRVQLMAEQIPNANSRVTLSNDRDALGLPRAALTWQLQPADHRTLRIAVELAAGQLANVGLGRISAASHGGSTPYNLIGGHHHMGTTRMHEDPERGVVDEHGRVHGTANLYVASCAVFPTGGFANPTLTIVALALRLGEHLREGGAA